MQSLFAPIKQKNRTISGAAGCLFCNVGDDAPNNWEKFSFGAWLKEATKRMHKNKVAAALVNKLSRIAWSILRNGNDFETHRIDVTAI